MITTSQNSINWADPVQVARFNLLTPVSITNERDLFQKSQISIVQISANPADKEVYLQKGGVGFSISKVGILKIAAAAGIKITTKLQYIDDQKIIFEATASYTDYSGQQRCGSGFKMKLFKNDEYALEKAESGAALRAIRELLALKGAYTKEELAKPFAVPHSVFAPNYADPEVKKIALQRFAQASNLLFGGVHESMMLPEATETREPYQSLPENNFVQIAPAFEEKTQPQVNHLPAPAPAPAPQVPVSPSENPCCEQCGWATEYREGETSGKAWAAFFCKEQCGAKPKWTKKRVKPDMSVFEPEYPDY